MIEEIRQKLMNPEVEVRRDTVLMLKGAPKGIERQDLIDCLITAMKDQSWRVRKTARDILIDEYPIDEYIKKVIDLLYLEENAGARNSAIETLSILEKKVTPHLIEAFKTTNVDVRKFIIDIIGMFNDKRALDLMLGALNDEDENVKAAAVEHLGSIGGPSVVEALVSILDEGDLWTAFPAADALGRIGDRAAIPALIRALSKKTLREPALKALGRLATDEEIKHIVPFLEDSSKVVQGESLKALEMLYHRGISESSLTRELKSHYGDRVLDVLVRHAGSNKQDVRISAILFLGLLKDERALDPLLAISQEEGYANDVKKALVFIGKEKPETLEPLFKTEDPYLRRFSCEVASEVASETYFDSMVGFMSDGDGHVRSLAAKTLSNIGDNRAINEILKLFKDPYSDVQEAAVNALSGFASELDVNELIEYLKDNDVRMRKNTARLLGRIGDASAVSSLSFALKDESVDVRKAVVEALASIKGDESIKNLVLALTDENFDIRASAALSLGTIGNETVIEPLCILLKDHDDTVKVAAAKALGMLGNHQAFQCLVDTLDDDNGFVVATAIESMGTLGGDDVREALLKMLDSEDSEIKRTAIRALAGYKGVDGVILPYIKDQDWATRIAAVETLSASLSDTVKAELEKRFDSEDDEAVRNAIEKALNV